MAASFRKQVRKMLAVLVSLTMVLSLVPAAAFATGEDEGTGGVRRR